MLCRKCGASMPDEYRFCSVCGTMINAAPAQPPVQAPNRAQQQMGRHFSLEDIARQQNEKNESRIGITSSAPSPAPVQPQPAQPQESGVQVKDKIKGPAVPFGEQSQVSFSIFSKDAAKNLEDIKNKKS